MNKPVKNRRALAAALLTVLLAPSVLPLTSASPPPPVAENSVKWTPADYAVCKEKVEGDSCPTGPDTARKATRAPVSTFGRDKRFHAAWFEDTILVHQVRDTTGKLVGEQRIPINSFKTRHADQGSQIGLTANGWWGNLTIAANQSGTTFIAFDYDPFAGLRNTDGTGRDTARIVFLELAAVSLAKPQPVVDFRVLEDRRPKSDRNYTMVSPSIAIDPVNEQPVIAARIKGSTTYDPDDSCKEHKVAFGFGVQIVERVECKLLDSEGRRRVFDKIAVAARQWDGIAYSFPFTNAWREVWSDDQVRNPFYFPDRYRNASLVITNTTTEVRYSIAWYDESSTNQRAVGPKTPGIYMRTFEVTLANGQTTGQWRGWYRSTPLTPNEVVAVHQDEIDGSGFRFTGESVLGFHAAIWTSKTEGFVRMAIGNPSVLPAFKTYSTHQKGSFGAIGLHLLDPAAPTESASIRMHVTYVRGGQVYHRNATVNEAAGFSGWTNERLLTTQRSDKTDDAGARVPLRADAIALAMDGASGRAILFYRDLETQTVYFHRITKPLVVFLIIDGLNNRVLVEYVDKWKHDPKYPLAYTAKNNSIVFVREIDPETGEIDPLAGGALSGFPSVTFPNQATLMTGRWPGSHGIVGNDFFLRYYDAVTYEDHPPRRTRGYTADIVPATDSVIGAYRRCGAADAGDFIEVFSHLSDLVLKEHLKNEFAKFAEKKLGKEIKDPEELKKIVKRSRSAFGFFLPSIFTGFVTAWNNLGRGYDFDDPAAADPKKPIKVGLTAMDLYINARTLYEHMNDNGLDSWVVSHQHARGADLYRKPDCMHLFWFALGDYISRFQHEFSIEHWQAAWQLFGDAYIEKFLDAERRFNSTRFVTGEIYDEVTVNNAIRLLERVERGEDDLPDLLTLYFSGLDHQSHIEGTISQEQNLKGYVTEEFGRFAKKLRDLGVYDDTIFVIASDHGQLDFGDHPGLRNPPKQSLADWVVNGGKPTPGCGGEPNPLCEDWMNGVNESYSADLVRSVRRVIRNGDWPLSHERTIFGEFGEFDHFLIRDLWEGSARDPVDTWQVKDIIGLIDFKWYKIPLNYVAERLRRMPWDFDAFFGLNGPTGVIYLRNSETKNWADLATDAEVRDLAGRLTANITFNPEFEFTGPDGKKHRKISGIFIRQGSSYYPFFKQWQSPCANEDAAELLELTLRRINEHYAYGSMPRRAADIIFITNEQAYYHLTYETLYLGDHGGACYDESHSSFMITGEGLDDSGVWIDHLARFGVQDQVMKGKVNVRYRTGAELVDVAPTVLDLLGVDTPRKPRADFMVGTSVFERRLVISHQSPTDIHCADSAGRITGSSAGHGIPNSFHFGTPGEPEAIVIYDPKDDYECALRGNGEGDVTVLVELEDKGKRISATYPAVNVLDGSRVTLGVPRGQLPTDLSIDVDGDGQPEGTIKAIRASRALHDFTQASVTAQLAEGDVSPLDTWGQNVGVTLVATAPGHGSVSVSSTPPAGRAPPQTRPYPVRFYNVSLDLAPGLSASATFLVEMDDLVLGGAVPTSLALYRADPAGSGSWEPVPATLDAAARSLTVDSVLSGFYMVAASDLRPAIIALDAVPIVETPERDVRARATIRDDDVASVILDLKADETVLSSVQMGWNSTSLAYEADVALGMEPRKYTLYVTATDLAGHVETASTSFETPPLDEEPPFVKFLVPQNVTHTTFTVSGTFSERVINVTLQVDEGEPVLVTHFDDSGTFFDEHVSVPHGVHDIKVCGSDRAGNRGCNLTQVHVLERNLELRDVSVQRTVAPDEPFRAAALILNTGNTDETAIVDLMHEKTAIGSVAVVIPAGETRVAEIRATLASTGERVLTFATRTVEPGEPSVDDNNRTARIFVARAPIALLVEDSAVGSFDGIAASLEANGVRVHRKDYANTWSLAREVLDEYPLVVWATGGDASRTLTLSEAEALQAYVSRGGRLLLAGDHLQEDIGHTAFYRSFLGASPAGTASGIAVGPTGDPILGGRSARVVDAEVVDAAPAVGAIGRLGGHAVGTFGVHAQGGKHVYFGFDPERIPARDRDALVERVVRWFGLESVPPRVLSLAPLAGTAFAKGTSAVTVTARASEEADCRFALSPGAYFEDMKTMPRVGARAYAASVEGLADGGEYAVHVRCRDRSWNLGVEASTSFRVWDRTFEAPVIAPLLPVTVAEGALARIEPFASDPEGDPVAFRFDAPFDAAGEWTPGFDDAGTYVVTVTAADPHASSSVQVPVTVVDVNRPPVLNDTSVSLVAGAYGSFVVDAFDPDAQTLTFTADSSLFAIDALTGRVGFVPSRADVGTHSVQITASDGEVTVEATLDLTIQAENAPPVLKFLKPIVTYANEPAEIVLTAEDPDGDLLLYGDDAAFFDVDAETGIARFTPLPADVGVHVVNFTVTDGVRSDTLAAVVVVRRSIVDPWDSPVGYEGDRVKFRRGGPV